MAPGITTLTYLLTYRDALMTVDSSGLSAPSDSSVTTAVATDTSAADYLERLKVLRARCGLDNDANTDSAPSDLPVNVTKSHVSASQAVDGSVSSVSTLCSTKLGPLCFFLL